MFCLKDLALRHLEWNSCGYWKNFLVIWCENLLKSVIQLLKLPFRVPAEALLAFLSLWQIFASAATLSCCCYCCSCFPQPLSPCGNIPGTTPPARTLVFLPSLDCRKRTREPRMDSRCGSARPWRQSLRTLACTPSPERRRRCCRWTTSGQSSKTLTRSSMSAASRHKLHLSSRLDYRREAFGSGADFWRP